MVPIDMFGQKLASLCRDDVGRRKMGDLSLQIVKEQFPWRKVAKSYEILMEGLVRK